MDTVIPQAPSPAAADPAAVHLLTIDIGGGRIYTLRDGSGWWDAHGWHIAPNEVPAPLLSKDGLGWWTGSSWVRRPERAAAADVSALTAVDAAPEPPDGYRNDVATGTAPPAQPEGRRAGMRPPVRAFRDRRVRPRGHAANPTDAAVRLLPTRAAPIVLMASPLTSATTWFRVADLLRRRGAEVLTVRADVGLDGNDAEGAAGLLASVLRMLPDVPAVFVAHAEAGPLLPRIAASSGHQVAACLLVDSTVPRAGASQLALLDEEAPTVGQRVRGELASTGAYPHWVDGDLRREVPDGYAFSRRLVQLGQHPLPLSSFTDALTVPEEWWAIPCGYLQLSSDYAKAAADARRLGWPVRTIPDGGHFEMLVRPGLVADAVQLLAAQLVGREPAETTIPTGRVDAVRRAVDERPAVHAA